MSAQHYTFTRFSVAALIALTAACGQSGVSSEPVTPRIVTNAATVNSSTIPELNLAGAPNDDGVAFVAAIAPNGGKHRLDVVNGEFVARNPGGPVAHGAEMVGWTLIIEKDGVPQDVMILGHEAGPVSLYALAIRDDEGELVNLCPSFADSPELPTMTLIGDERYDAETKEVIAEQESWVTLACRDEALFKMKSLGYVPYETKAIHRQATLKMITGDYCGTGHSFTEDGTPLVWQNFEGTIGKDAGEGQIEALWNEYGALCLSTPRLAALAEITEHCTLPVCDEELLAKGGEYEWITWTP